MEYLITPISVRYHTIYCSKPPQTPYTPPKKGYASERKEKCVHKMEMKRTKTRETVTEKVAESPEAANWKCNSQQLQLIAAARQSTLSLSLARGDTGTNYSCHKSLRENPTNFDLKL